jgi:glutamate-1-semialdehyde 2,1-aminomutase
MEQREVLENFRRRAKSAGLKVTPQRVAVYMELVLRKDHPCAEELYESLRKKTEKLTEGLKESARKAGIEHRLCFKSIESMSVVFFTDRDVKNYSDALTSNTSAYALFFQKMLEQGIYLAPSQFEVAFVSTAHTEEDIEKTVEASELAFEEVARAFYR